LKVIEARVSEPFGHNPTNIFEDRKEDPLNILRNDPYSSNISTIIQEISLL
jgi:hypothetical protein